MINIMHNVQCNKRSKARYSPFSWTVTCLAPFAPAARMLL